MNVLPVITRELRTQARQPFTYWLRLLGVVALLICGVFFAGDVVFNPNRGSSVFGYMHLTLYCAVWILVPFGAADCLSRERREGTMGLLFLTPLKPPDIVIAKGLSHGLRAITLLVAVLPVLTIPFLIGGVSWQQATVSAVINMSAICWALSAALVASAIARNATHAISLAIVLAVLGLLTYTYLVGLTVGSGMGTRWRGGYSSLAFNYLVGFGITGLHSEVWSALMTMIKMRNLLSGILQSAGLSLLALAGAVVFAANRVKHSWQDEPPSIRRQQIEKVLFQPVIWVSFLKRWMRWKLERNPIGWLEQRRWSGRLVTWTWFAIIISVQSTALTDRNFYRYYDTWQMLMAWALAVSMAASAAGSFRRERETGVLELLLVSPLTTGQIIGGRLRGLWGQFLPSVVTLIGIWLYFLGIFRTENNFAPVWFFLVTYLVVPVIGLYFSVQCRLFISAFLLTVATAIALPIMTVIAVKSLWWFYAVNSGHGIVSDFWDSTGAIRLIQLWLAAVFGLMLYQKLKTRSFPLEQGGR